MCTTCNYATSLIQFLYLLFLLFLFFFFFASFLFPKRFLSSTNVCNCPPSLYISLSPPSLIAHYRFLRNILSSVDHFLTPHIQSLPPLPILILSLPRDLYNITRSTQPLIPRSTRPHNTSYPGHRKYRTIQLSEPDILVLSPFCFLPREALQNYLERWESRRLNRDKYAPITFSISKSIKRD